MRTGGDPTPAAVPAVHGRGGRQTVARPVGVMDRRRWAGGRAYRVVAAAALAALLVVPAGCARPDGDPSGAPTGSPTSPAAPTTPPGAPSPSPPSAPPGQPTPSVPPGARIETVTGQVVEGVELNCLLLRPTNRLTPSGGGLLLIVSPGTLRVGATVTVRGYVDRSLLTTCQQGTPFVVLEVLDDGG